MDGDENLEVVPRTDGHHNECKYQWLGLYLTCQSATRPTWRRNIDGHLEWAVHAADNVFKDKTVVDISGQNPMRVLTSEADRLKSLRRIAD
jgi:hypothetical protein